MLRTYSSSSVDSGESPLRARYSPRLVRSSSPSTIKSNGTVRCSPAVDSTLFTSVDSWERRQATGTMYGTYGMEHPGSEVRSRIGSVSARGAGAPASAPTWSMLLELQCHTH